jgi:hypothetical protein
MLERVPQAELRCDDPVLKETAMAHEPDRSDPDDIQRRPPIFLRMADKGSIPGRLPAAALVFIVGVAVVGLVAIFFAIR